LTSIVRRGGAGGVLAGPDRSDRGNHQIQTDSLTVLRKQFQLGHVAGADVAAIEATLAQAQATLPPLQKQLAVQRDLLTALIGRFPSQEPAERIEIASLQLPQQLPVSLPSKLVEAPRMCAPPKHNCMRPAPRSVSLSPPCCRNSR
jgi:hypothetical protein